MEGTKDDLPAKTHVKQNNNKRKSSFSDSEDLKNYSKIRAIVQRLRPHFMEVLQTPDFRNCKAADEIRKDLKQVLDLYKQMILQTDAPVNLVTEHTAATREEAADNQPTLFNENAFREEAPQEGKEAAESLKTEHTAEKSTDMKMGKEAADTLKTKHTAEKSTDVKCSMPYSSSEEKKLNGVLRHSYIVGGSVYGKNFITYGGSKLVYYGPRKNSYLRRQMKSE